jgi:hypothetical protein
MPFFTLISSNGLLPEAFDMDKALLFGVKSMFIVAGVLYLLFAILITRQISIMSSTISTTASPKIKLLGLVHLVTAIFVLIYFFTVL